MQAGIVEKHKYPIAMLSSHAVDIHSNLDSIFAIHGNSG